jgi:hypothetical protein
MDEFDHRSLGIKLDLYHIQEDAPGMVFRHPRGYAVYGRWRTISAAACAGWASPRLELRSYFRARCGAVAAIGTGSATTCSASRAMTAGRWR